MVSVGEQVVIRKYAGLVVGALVEAEVQTVVSGDAVVRTGNELVEILNHGGAVNRKAVRGGTCRKIFDHRQRGGIEPADRNLIIRERVARSRIADQHLPPQRIRRIVSTRKCRKVTGE